MSRSRYVKRRSKNITTQLPQHQANQEIKNDTEAVVGGPTTKQPSAEEQAAVQRAHPEARKKEAGA